MKRLSLLSFLAVAAAMLGCTVRNRDTAPSDPTKVNVAVSFPALYSFAAKVVGETGTVRTVRTTQGAHGSEVTAADRELVASVDLLFVNGLTLDDNFAAKVTKGTNSTGVRVVNIGKHLPEGLLLSGDGCECCKDEGDKKEGNEGHEGHDHDHDPHAWLGPDLAEKYVEIIRRELGERYPDKKETFDANSAAFTKELKQLKADGKAALAGVPKSERKLVTVHGSLGYFASAFDVTISGIVQTTPGQEPTPKQLANLIALCEKEKVGAIAVEPQFSSKGAVKVLTDALKAKGIADPIVIELDPLETATSGELTPEWYVAKMKSNIEAIGKAFPKK